MQRILRHQRRFYTRNAAPGVRVYGERLLRLKGAEWREWSARRSKLAAYLAVGGRGFQPAPDAHWLYLGAASGTTVSHVGDLVPQGRIVAVESASRPFHALLELAQRRDNILPVLSDAGRPEAYAPLLERRVDVVYQDIAQRDQDRLFVANLERFLATDGSGFLAIKARSIDVAAAPKEIFARVRRRVEAEGWRTEEALLLDPWQKDHAMLRVRRR